MILPSFLYLENIWLLFVLIWRKGRCTIEVFEKLTTQLCLISYSIQRGSSSSYHSFGFRVCGTLTWTLLNPERWVPFNTIACGYTYPTHWRKSNHIFSSKYLLIWKISGAKSSVIYKSEKIFRQLIRYDLTPIFFFEFISHASEDC